ncbi:MAG: FAD:protein FMN transferase [Lachnospiraceae bacterium]
MKKRMKKAGIFVVCLLMTGMFAGCAKEQTEEVSAEEISTEKREIFAMDTYMTLTASGKQAKEALDTAEEEIQRLDELLSVGNGDSEVSVVNENGSIILTEDTAYLLERSLELYESTDGAFDITIYPLMEEWGFTTGVYQVPEKSRIEELGKKVNASLIEYEKGKKMLSLPEGVQIDFGGIAKGYASSRVMEIFEKYDIVSGMVSLGGNVQLYRTKTDGSLWRVAVEDPEGTSDYIGILEAEDKAVITSGGYERYFEQDGITWHHILDPKTGYPAESGLTSVTIVSSDGTLADGLSTALFVMGKEKALEYWRQNSRNFDVILVEEDGSLTITEGIKDTFSSDREVTVEKE